MSDDIARIGFAADSTQLDSAKKSLDDLSTAAAKTEAATESLSKATAESSDRYKEIARSAMERKAALDEEVRAAAASSQETRKVTAEMQAQAREYTRVASAELAAQKAAEKQAKSLADAAAAAEKNRESLQKLLGQIDPLEAKLNRLDDMEQKLHQSFKQGALDADAYAIALAKIGGQRKDIGDQQLKQVAMGAKEAASMMERLGLNTSSAHHDLVMLGKAAASGNLSQASSSMFQLGRASGVMSTAFSVAGLSILGLTAGIGALALAYFKGSQESVHFNQSLALTGGYAGVTSAQLSDMAKSIGATVGTTSAAADALNRMVATGKLYGDGLKEMGAAAVAMSEATGKSVDDTIQEFVRLGEAPSEAILKLNEKYHFLTESVYEQIVALEKQGRTQEAAELAQRTYAATGLTRASQIKSSMGSVEMAWDAVATAASKAWSNMLNIGREKGGDALKAEASRLQNQLSEVEKSLGDPEFGRRSGGGYDLRAGFEEQSKKLKERLANLNADIAAQQKQASEAERIASEARRLAEKAAADKLLKDLGQQYESRKEQREREIKENTIAAEKAGWTQEQLQIRIAQINEKYKDKKTPAAKGVTDDAATRMLLRLKEQEATLGAQLVAEGKITTAQSERLKFEQQIADLKEKRVLTADQKSLLANEGAIRAQLEKNEAISLEVKQRDELNKMLERSAQLQASIASEAKLRAEQYASQLASYGLGSQAQERSKAEYSLRKSADRELAALAKSASQDVLNSAAYTAEADKIRAALEAALGAQKDYYQNLDALQSDWKAGASKGLADYADMASKVAQSASGAFTNAFKGMEDALVSFVTTGKADFASLADSIIKDMVRIAVQQSITGPLASAIGSMFAPSAAPAGVTPGVDWTYGGGKASGGSTQPGKFYEVNEQGPELYTQGGRTFLMSGDKGGYVTPASTGGGRTAGQAQAIPSVSINITNTAGQQVGASQPKVSMDALGNLLIEMVMADNRKNGPMTRSIRGAM